MTHRPRPSREGPISFLPAPPEQVHRLLASGHVNRTDRASPTSGFPGAFPGLATSTLPASSLSWALQKTLDMSLSPSAPTALSVKRGDGGSALAAGEMRAQSGEGELLLQRPHLNHARRMRMGTHFALG